MLNTYSSCPQVAYNEADLSVGDYQCIPARTAVVDCSQSTYFGHYHWISRAPRELLPIWNMLGIFDYHSWWLLIFTMFVIYGFLLVTAKVGACYGLAYHYEEIPLFPVR